MLVLDTHILIWWVSNDPKLETSVKARIEACLEQGKPVFISAITAWEIAMLVEKGRLVLTMDTDSWLDTVSKIEHLSFVPIDNKVAVESTRLPGEFHKDPADRMIVALARVLSAPLVSADEKICSYPGVKTL